MTMDNHKDILGKTEVADLLDCEPSTIEEAARSGTLPALKFGRSWIFPRAALLEALNRRAAARCEVAAAPAPAPAPQAISVDVPRRGVRREPPKLVDLRSAA